jgi:hypothetical protein
MLTFKGTLSNKTIGPVSYKQYDEDRSDNYSGWVALAKFHKQSSAHLPTSR